MKLYILIYLCVISFVFVSSGESATYYAHNANEITGYIDFLAAGDSLLIEGGQYDIGAIWISNKHGTENDWIVIQGKDSLATLMGSVYENVINLDNVSYIKFENIGITTDETYDGIDGVTFRSNSHHVTFKKCYIHHVTNVGINSQVPEIHHIVVSECEISYCSLVGIYWGYPDPLKIARDCIIERSYIHHCPIDSTEPTGYGIQLKGGSYRNIVRDNVLHDVGGTTRAGLAVYYPNNSGGWAVSENNIVTGNVIWNVSSEGIFTSAGITLENNIVFDAGTGIAIYPHDGSVTENVIVRNNTVYRCASEGIYISGWSNAGNDCMIINNVSYMENPFVYALQSGNKGNAIFSHNYYFGQENGFGTGAIRGNGPSADFISAGTSLVVPNLDFYPSDNSIFINAGSDSFGLPQTDFNGYQRIHGNGVDVGAYEKSRSQNPGWRISENFKEIGLTTTTGNFFLDKNNNEISTENSLYIYPNPFNSKTVIRLHIVRSPYFMNKKLIISVFDVTGRLVKKLFNKNFSDNYFSIEWNGTDFFENEVSSGIYIIRVLLNEDVISKKLIYLK